MAETVPGLSILFMGISLVVSAALPIGLCVFFRKAKKADLEPFFIGCGVMILFAFVLESFAHRFILNSKAGAVIMGNIWLYGLYGGAMAGLFEESGRFIAFKTVLRKKQNNDANALMYGAGHGGIEAFIILGITSINNILYSVLINTGRTSVLTGPLSGEMLTQAEGAVQALITTPSWHFLLGSVERILAIIVQISFSVLLHNVETFHATFYNFYAIFVNFRYCLIYLGLYLYFYYYCCYYYSYDLNYFWNFWKII